MYVIENRGRYFSHLGFLVDFYVDCVEDAFKWEDQAEAMLTAINHGLGRVIKIEEDSTGRYVLSEGVAGSQWISSGKSDNK